MKVVKPFILIQTGLYLKKIIIVVSKLKQKREARKIKIDGSM